MAAAKPPANQPIVAGDPRQLDPIWLAFFQAMTAQIAALEARLKAAGIP